MYAIQMLIFEKHFFSNGEFEFPGTQLSLDEYLSSADMDSKKKLRSALHGASYCVQVWRGVAMYFFCPLRAQ